MDNLPTGEKRPRADSHPRIPIERHARTFVPERLRQAAQVFLETEAAGGIILLFAAVVALVWVNSPLGDHYKDLWSTPITIDLRLFTIDEDLQHLVNDGLMTIFFFLVGLEIKRELVHGELSAPRRALLPAAAALGGMALPAAIYLVFNLGDNAEAGWGIPMATDIAFAIGVLSLVGRRVPFGVKIFLLALAILDDIGAILVIALFYTSDLALDSLGLAAALFALIFAMNNRGVRNVNLYVVVGALMWVAMLKSGVHPTITGVVLGLMTPAVPFYDRSGFGAAVERLVTTFRAAEVRGAKNDEDELLKQVEDVTTGSQAPLERLEAALHPWVSFGVMPIFALANAGVEISGDVVTASVSSATTQGVVLGLLVGKLVGILFATWLAVRLGVASLPDGANWLHVSGVALVGGIGFTVSLFITGLAFEDPALVDEARIGIMAASVVAGAAGFVWLRFIVR